MSDSISPQGEHLPTAIQTPQEQDLAPKDRELLDQLGKLWEDHSERDLVVRHETGRLLNHHFGSPAVTRQSRGQQVLKLVAERLGTNLSDLSRMRWFAEHFKTLEALKEGYPGVDNWTRVKALLSTLNSQEGGQGAAKTKGQSAILRELMRSLEALSSKFGRITQDPGDLEKEAFQAKLREFVEALPGVLQVRLSVEELGKGESVRRKVTK
jgi:hypothetical protein